MLESYTFRGKEFVTMDPIITENSESDEEKTGYEICKNDLVSGLVRCGIIEKFGLILSNSLAPATNEFIIDILVMISRHSLSIAHEIVKVNFC